MLQSGIPPLDDRTMYRYGTTVHPRFLTLSTVKLQFLLDIFIDSTGTVRTIVV